MSRRVGRRASTEPPADRATHREGERRATHREGERRATHREGKCCAMDGVMHKGVPKGKVAPLNKGSYMYS